MTLKAVDSTSPLEGGINQHSSFESRVRALLQLLPKNLNKEVSQVSHESLMLAREILKMSGSQKRAFLRGLIKLTNWVRDEPDQDYGFCFTCARLTKAMGNAGQGAPLGRPTSASSVGRGGSCEGTFRWLKRWPKACASHTATASLPVYTIGHTISSIPSSMPFERDHPRYGGRTVGTPDKPKLTLLEMLAQKFPGESTVSTHTKALCRIQATLSA
jgi:hypothetical protein